MTALPNIIKGVYSTKEATLLLDTVDTLIWVRDSIITKQEKTDIQKSSSNLSFYTTQDGIILSGNYLNSGINSNAKWQYTYNPISGSLPVPLTMQTAYFGQTANQKSNIKEFVIVLYSQTKSPITVELTERSKDQDAHYENVTKIPLIKKDWDSRGYAQVRVQPKYQKSLGTSLQIDITEKVTILDVSIVWDDNASATIAQNKSR
jgi:hypothetical protein